MHSLWPDSDVRLAVQCRLAARLSATSEGLADGPVSPTLDGRATRDALAKFDFQTPMALDDALDNILALLEGGIVHTAHPLYFGLFNPAANFPGILADHITAALNPQLAATSHAPIAVEIERHMVSRIGMLCGWLADDVFGHFTSGGAEANYTAVIVALTKIAPDFATHGARALSGSPRLYVSAESHLAWIKIAHQCGIGRGAVRLVATDGSGRMDVDALATTIAEDRAHGDLPFFIGATAGTTNAGMPDPVDRCRAIASREGLWLHVDAAWGGAGLLTPRARPALAGIETADSITIDAHKWFSVPMGAGIFLTRERRALAATFAVSTDYMPAASDTTDDPYSHSIQWSRRFIGLKLFLAMATLGLDGYRAVIERSLDLASELRSMLAEAGWRIVNDSPFAVLCFTRDGVDVERVAARIVKSGKAWLSTAKFEGQVVLRACITSHFTRSEDIRALVDHLEAARLADAAPPSDAQRG